MLAKIKDFVKAHLDDIILLIGVILISLLSFAMGYITAKQQGKEPIRIESVEEGQALFSICAFAERKLITQRDKSLFDLRFCEQKLDL